MEISAKELRIGNLILYNGQVKPITSVWQNSPNNDNSDIDTGVSVPIKGDKDKHIHKLRFIKPIPLTKDWLLKFGLEEEDGKYYFYNPLLMIEVYFTDYCIIKIIQNDNTICTDTFEYVHQLQNLYFALTEEELEIKK